MKNQNLCHLDHQSILRSSTLLQRTYWLRAAIAKGVEYPYYSEKSSNKLKVSLAGNKMEVYLLGRCIHTPEYTARSFKMKLLIALIMTFSELVDWG